MRDLQGHDASQGLRLLLTIRTGDFDGAMLSASHASNFTLATAEQLFPIVPQFTFGADEPVERLSGDTQFGAKISHFRFGLSHGCSSKPQFGRCHLERSPAIAAPSAGRRKSHLGALHNQLTLELSQTGEDGEDQPSICGRGVD